MNVCVLLLGASAFPNVRPKIAGLLVHPVTLATLVLVVVGAAGLRRLPRSVALALLTFVATFAVSSLAGPPGGVNFAVKVAASAVAVAVGATFVRTRADLRVVIIAFALAVATMLSCSGRVVVMGMGKSGHVGRKIAATLASTGTPAFFVHPAEASHGDLGMVQLLLRQGASCLVRRVDGTRALFNEQGPFGRPRRHRRFVCVSVYM